MSIFHKVAMPSVSVNAWLKSKDRERINYDAIVTVLDWDTCHEDDKLPYAYVTHFTVQFGHMLFTNATEAAQALGHPITPRDIVTIADELLKWHISTK